MAFTQNPLSKVWELNYAQDCGNYMWEMWFLFRNLQLDCKACLPWLSLLSSEILFTILAAPFILIYRVNKKLGHALFGLIIFTSIMISYAILSDEKIIFMPTKLMNAQKEYVLNYQSNSFVRMGSFFFGLFIGLFILEGFGRENAANFEEKVAKAIRKSTKIEHILHFLGFSLVVISYSLVALYFNTSPLEPFSNSSRAYLILVPLTFLIGLTYFCFLRFGRGIRK